MANAPDSPKRKSRRPARGAELFRAGFGEELVSFLDLGTWSSGRDLDVEYQRIQAEVEHAVVLEQEHQQRIRDEVHPLLADYPDAPPGAGRHRMTLQELEDIHRGLLFNGAVEACDGTVHTHDSLALTVHQIGISLVSYRGQQDCWQQQLFRRDVRERGQSVEDVIELLSRRGERGALDDGEGDPLSRLVERGLMAYAERAVLARKATAPWRLGHGSVAPVELVGAEFADLAVESIKVIGELIEHKCFVFVASEPKARSLLMIGQALLPLEFAIIGRLPERLARLEDWSASHPATVDTRWDGKELSPEEWVGRFLRELAPKVVYGVYRARPLAPPQVFYAHEEYAEVAARIAIADSVFFEERGFPALIDLADRVCNSVYGGGSLEEMASSAYAASGAPFRYGSERQTRSR